MHPTIQTYFNAFNAGDVDGMLNCLDDAVAHHVNEGQVRIGKDARECIERLIALIASSSAVRDEAEAADDSVDDNPSAEDAESANAIDAAPEPTAESETASVEVAEEAEPAETEEESIARERAE